MGGYYQHFRDWEQIFAEILGVITGWIFFLKFGEIKRQRINVVYPIKIKNERLNKLDEFFERPKVLHFIKISLFILVSSFLILFLWLGFNKALTDAGLKLNVPFLSLLVFIVIFLYAALALLKDLGAQINGWFIFAFILSICILIIGVNSFSQLYRVETDINTMPSRYYYEDYLRLTNNETATILFYPLKCESTKERDYFSKNDNLFCTFNISLQEDTKYKLYTMESTKSLINYSSETLTSACKNNSCTFHLYLMDNAEGYTLIPTFVNKSDIGDKIQPIYYKIDIPGLREETDLKNLEYNKATLLLAIITAAFVVSWSGVYYAKKILEK